MSKLTISVTAHAIQRLDERAYLRFFRSFRLGENKQKWLARYSQEAIQQGLLLKPTEEKIIRYWHRGLLLAFERSGKVLTLLTIFPKSKPRKRQILELTNKKPQCANTRAKLKRRERRI